MELVWVKTHEYCCTKCGKQYDFKEGESVRFGKMEYKDKEEEMKKDKHFCNIKCFNLYETDRKS